MADRQSQKLADHVTDGIAALTGFNPIPPVQNVGIIVQIDFEGDRSVVAFLLLFRYMLYSCMGITRSDTESVQVTPASNDKLNAFHGLRSGRSSDSLVH